MLTIHWLFFPQRYVNHGILRLCIGAGYYIIEVKFMTNNYHNPQKKQKVLGGAFTDRCASCGFILEHSVKIIGFKPSVYGVIGGSNVNQI